MHDTLHQHHDHDHSTALQEKLKTLILIGLGFYFVFIIATGSLTNYINLRFAWLSYVAAALFLILGISSALRLRQSQMHHHHDHDYDDHAHHDHDHVVITWPVLAVVALPLILGTLIPSRPLGAAAVDGDLSLSGVTGADSAAFSIAPEDRNILDWLRAFNNAEDPAAFNGQPVDLIGFVYRPEDFTPDQFMVARFTISCCVADSLAVGLPVTWAEAPATDNWVHVRGQLQLGEFRGESQPVIQPDNVEIIDQPEHPYLYP